MNTAIEAKPRTLEFFVQGNPAAQGSKRHIGHGRLIESSKTLQPWRERIGYYAVKIRDSEKAEITDKGAALYLQFVMPRPKNTPKNTPLAIKRPDLDKLIRAVFDAITNILIVDDSQITMLAAYKRLAQPNEETGVLIRMEWLP